MKIHSYSPLGYEGDLIQVEVDFRSGIPGFDIVGLAGNAIKEAKERVRSAIANNDFQLPRSKRILINLSPADIKKTGTAFDLAIALAILKKSYNLSDNDKNILVLGEIHLNGDISALSCTASALFKAKEEGIEYAIIPDKQKEEVNFIQDITIYPVKNICDAFETLEKIIIKDPNLKPLSIKKYTFQNNTIENSLLLSLKGHKRLKRALEVSSAGAHHLLLFGPPGTGKTLSAKAITSLLPSLSEKEFFEVSRIYASQNENYDNFNSHFRAPHHSFSK